MQEQYIALQRLTRMRFHLVHNLTREKQYFLQNLFYKCNAFRSEVDSSVFGHAIKEMLSEKYSLDEIASMDVADLADYLKEKGKNRFPIPERVARCIQKAARASYRFSGRCAATQRPTLHASEKGEPREGLTPTLPKPFGNSQLKYGKSHDFRLGLVWCCHFP
jgi:hypothetical protein